MTDVKTEINLYLQEVSDILKKTKDTKKIKNIVKDAKKKVVLKTLDSKVKKRSLKDYAHAESDLL